MKRKTIDLMEFNCSSAELDSLYDKPAYEKPFVIETNYGTVHTVKLIWSQGRGNNYNFESDDCSIHPSDVAYIEDRIWNHIK